MVTGQKVLAIVGPTAVGKSALAIRLARELGGEIVSADSRQVYRYMDIGTAKPTAEQRRAVRHHIIDVVDPDEEYSLSLFLSQAQAALEDIWSRSKLPIVVGGTGQYIWGLLEGWQVPQVPPIPALRRTLEARVLTEGATILHDELAMLDPAAAGRIDPQNTRRVIRALEVHHSSPNRPSPHPSRGALAFDPLILGLTVERGDLYERINERVDAMMEAGWAMEVEGLMGRGYSLLALPSLSSLGYRELWQHLRGELSLDEAVDMTKRGTRRFAKQQYAWFRLRDERIQWFQGSPDGHDAAAARASQLLARP